MEILNEEGIELTENGTNDGDDDAVVAAVAVAVGAATTTTVATVAAFGGSGAREQRSLLAETIEYHQERTRTYGVLSCELWLSSSSSSSSGRKNGRGEKRGFAAALGKTIKSKDRSGAKKAAALLSNEEANRLWNEQRSKHDAPDCRWVAASELAAIADREGNKDSNGNGNDNGNDIERNNADDSSNAVVVAAATPNTAVGCIGVVPFCRHNRAGENLEGMVCWFFRPVRARGGQQPPPNTHPAHEDFLVAASQHIVSTCGLEFCFSHLPLPKCNRRSHTVRSKETRKLMPHDLGYNDDEDHQFHSRRGGAGTPKIPPKLRPDIQRVMTSKEIHGDDSDDESSNRNDCGNGILPWARKGTGNYFRKFGGGGHRAPKALSWIQTVFIFVGTFLTIFIVNFFNEVLGELDDGYQQSVNVTNTTTSYTYEHWWGGNSTTTVSYTTEQNVKSTALQMGPFGATCVLIFAMTTAAPSQPRNVLSGTMIGMFVGQLVAYLGLAGVDLRYRMSLATALAASIMAKATTIYPPGGALALIFSSRLLGWDQFGLQVAGTILAVSMGVIINNLHPNRRYPTFWLGFHLFGKHDDDDDE